LLVDGIVDKDSFTSKRNALMVNRTKAEQKLAEIQKGSSAALELVEETVELAKSPSTAYKTASSAKRRELAKTLLSNLTVSGKNVEVTLAPPFQLIAERQKIPEGGPNRGS